VEAGHYGVGRARGDGEARPVDHAGAAQAEARQPRLAKGRHRGKRRGAPRAADRQHAQEAALHVAERGAERHHHQVHLARQHGGHRLAGAAERDVEQPHARGLREGGGAEVGRGADAARAVGDPLGLAPGGGHQGAQVGPGRVAVHREHHRREGRHGHRAEGRFVIEGQALEQVRQHGVGVVHRQQGVAVGRGARHLGRADRARGARLVLHHHWPAQRLRELGGEAARDRVCCAAGCPGDDDAQRAHRPRLTLGGRRRMASGRAARLEHRRVRRCMGVSFQNLFHCFRNLISL
jgi:hypothetical protein